MARHLVAGAAGFLGSHLVDRLLAQGDEVIGVDNVSTGRARNLDEARRSARFRFEQQDVIRPLDVEGPLDRVWNLASPASPPDYQRLAVETLRVGSEGTRNLLDLANAKGARFFQASTSEVYGDPDVTPQSESYWGRVNPVGPRSMYDESKRFAEALVMAYRARGTKTRIVRIFNTYGPRMRLDDGRVVPNLIGQALRGEPLTIYGDGNQTRSFCFVDDEVEGLVRLMESDHDLPVNLGNPTETTILEFADAIEHVAGRQLMRVFLPRPTDDPMQRRPDITKARTLLGWEPRVQLEEGLRRTYEWFAKNG
ncbi:MAG: UDP-glucuronic acid decarboxylase family protein [Candidatus Thermoplasmatota archaeon]